MPDAALAWIANSQCQWCLDPITSPEHCAVNYLTGRVVHTDGCELDLIMKHYEWFTAIFKGGDHPKD